MVRYGTGDLHVPEQLATSGEPKPMKGDTGDKPVELVVACSDNGGRGESAAGAAPAESTMNGPIPGSGCGQTFSALRRAGGRLKPPKTPYAVPSGSPAGLNAGGK